MGHCHLYMEGHLKLRLKPLLTHQTKLFIQRLKAKTKILRDPWWMIFLMNSSNTFDFNEHGYNLC